jgi:hypothetical protein
MLYKSILFGLALFSSHHISAQHHVDSISKLELTIIDAWRETKVPMSLLKGIIAWECNNDFSLKIKNKNKTYDLGPGLNSKWLKEFAYRFNKGKKIDPHSLEAVFIVARILANNHKVFNNWDWTITSYRRGVEGSIMNGIDWYYANNVRRLGNYYGN